MGRFERSYLSSSGNVFARLNGDFAREMVSPVVALKAGHKFPSITHSVGKDQV